MSGPPRGELLRLLSGVDYPATKQQIHEKLVAQGAPPACLAALEDLPEGTYVEPDTALQAIPYQSG
ncbi:uncharacterized protein DUF2795 [Saccharopolyspora erythraea NRRL 2338]|uniref:DUF2795 domain-containing protein n=2 Tax=Saccharopolyspora erythraea TaxID=1836 RepID=A4FL25_SACEN|nr:DUF2795 domain-containing protein [Saccharopolyspora erythraea]EQD81920.1 hypothetical protein N599_33530 [Saccharopolyspora erythraea D]PFG98390.1 uncharacterized protein DUF2795 [Saccharopolyspora erythraea NRRL 2338]QRK88460.1 DUF2795 domain-containing protein [Saccharopolyspora erythraea]CAM04750.1 hypothetical protein SACE_5564 [Saccharopolyspora erythraea NRRL 2338]